MSSIVLILWIPVWSSRREINYLKVPVFIFRACRLSTCEVTCNSVDQKWDGQWFTYLWILNDNRMTGVGWLLQKQTRCFINLYTMNYTLNWTQEMMVKMINVDTLMEYYKVNLPSLRVVICNCPWYFLEKPLSVILRPSLYLYWEISIVYFRISLSKYHCISVDVKLHMSSTTNQRVWYFNLYTPNSSDPIIPYICREVGPLTKRKGLSILQTGLFPVSIKFYFPLSFPLAGNCRVVPVFPPLPQILHVRN